MPQTFEFTEFFDFDSFNKELENSSEQLTGLENQLLKMSKIPEIKLFGDFDDMKKNNEQIDKLIKLQDAKGKIDIAQLKIETQREKLQQSQIKTQKDRINLEKTAAKQRKERIKQNKESVKQTKNLIQLINTQVKTEREAKELNKELRKTRLDVNVETEKGRKQLELINKTIDRNNEFLEQNTDQLTKQKTGIGRYTEGIIGAIKQTKGFDNVMTVVSKNPLLLVLTAIVGVLTGMFKAFQQTEKGAILFKQAGVVLNAIFGQFTKILASMAEFLIDKLSPAFNFIVKVIDKVSKSFSEGTEEGKSFLENLKEQAKAAAELVKLEEAYRRLNRQQSIRNKGLEAELAFHQQIADDATRSLQDQLNATYEVQRISEQLSEERLQRAERDLELINLRIDAEKAAGNDTRDLLDQQAEQINMISDLQIEQTQLIADNAKLRREVQRDAFELELDFLIDTFDKEKNIRERQIANDKLLYDERVKRLKDLQSLSEINYQQQTQLIEEFTGLQINFNELVAESDAKVIAGKIKALNVDEITSQRIREIIQERKVALQDLIEVEQELINIRNQANDIDIKRLDQANTKQKELDEFGESEVLKLQDRLKREQFIRERDAKEIEKIEQQKRDAFNTTFNAVSDAIAIVDQLRIDQLNNELDVLDERIRASEDNVNKQKQLAEQGKANSLSIAEEELNALRDIEDEKTKELEEAEQRQRAFAAVQIALSTAATSAELIKAAAEAISAHAGIPFVGVALGLAAAATIVTGFLGIKKQLQGFHDGTEYVDGPAGYDNAGVFKLEKGERVISTKDNNKIPRNISNDQLPGLINHALALETMQTPNQLLTVVNENKIDNKEEIEYLKKIYRSSQNKEEIIGVNGKFLHVTYKNGKVISKKWFN